MKTLLCISSTYTCYKKWFNDITANKGHILVENMDWYDDRLILSYRNISYLSAESVNCDDPEKTERNIQIETAYCGKDEISSMQTVRCFSMWRFGDWDIPNKPNDPVKYIV